MTDYGLLPPEQPLPPPSEPDPDFQPSWIFTMTEAEQDEFNRTGKKPERLR